MIYTAQRIAPNVVKKNRAFYERHKKTFVKWCAYKGFFDDVFDKRELKQAIKGNLPRYLDIHHKKLLSTCLEPNGFDNLCVITKSKHKKIHEHIDIQLRGFYNQEIGYQRDIIIPDLGSVDTQSILQEKRLQKEIISGVRGFKKR